MASVGDKLRKARVEQGRELAGIAGKTRISHAYLEAIEKGDSGALPGSFFARSFVRQYAAELGIPWAEIEPDLARWLPAEPAVEPFRLKPNSPVAGLAPLTHVLDGGRRPRRKVFGAVAALILVIGACAALYAYWLRGQRTPLIPAVAPNPVAAAQAPPVPPAPPVSAALEPEAPVAPAAAQAEAPASEPAPQGPLWFEISAVEEVWVRVKTGDRTLYMGILQPGESRRFSGLEFATLRVGNAGGLTLRVNGRPVPRIGPRGHIRVIHLTPEKTDIVAPPRTPARFDEGN